jgi:hypothetical protein
VEGWAVDQVVPVPLTGVPIQPKIAFPGKPLIVNPTLEINEASVVASINHPDYYDMLEDACLSYELTEGGQSIKGEGILEVDIRPYHDGSGRIMLAFSRGTGFGSAEKPRTFSFTLNVLGKAFPLTIMTLAENKAALRISVRAKGAIDRAVPNSPVTLDVTLKNTSTVHPDAFHEEWNCGLYTVEIFRDTYGAPVNTITSVESPERFIFAGSGLTRITLTQEDLGGAAYDPTTFAYTAKVAVDYGESPAAKAETEVKIPAKSSDPNKVPMTVTAKASGKIDVLNPDSAVLLTPAIKNGYGIDLNNSDLVELKFYWKDGRDYKQLSDAIESGEDGPEFDSKLFSAEPNAEGTGLLIRMTPGYGVNHKTDRFFVKFSVTDPADDTRTAETKQYIALPLTMGKAKITQDTTALTFLKKDKNSSGSIILGTENPAHRIVGAEITNDRQGLYQLTEVGYGTYVISCTDRVTPKTAKNTTLKLAVTLAENNSGSPNATVSVKIRWA